jgi:hypothetical protein
MLFQSVTNESGSAIFGLTNKLPILALSFWAWGGIALGAVVVGFLLALFFFEYMLTRFNQLNFLAPFRIQFVPAADISWTAQPAALALSDQLRELGFAEVGAFDIPEMPQAQIHGFVHEPTDVTARIYKLKDRLWVDLASYYQDGSSITYSTTDIGEKLPRPSAQTLIRFPEMSLAQLHHRLVQDRPRGKLRSVSTENFVEICEEAHAVYQDWLAERGGYNVEELRILGPGNDKLSADGLQALRQNVAREALINWFRTQPDRPFEAERINDCTPIIHDDLSIEQIVFVFNRVTGDWDADKKHIPPSAKSPCAAFEALNEIRKGGLVKIFEKATPLCADFYILSEEAEEIESAPPGELVIRERRA